MAVYALAQLTMKNRAAYDRYQARFMEVFRHYRGQLLAADEAPTVLEGKWPMDKLVLISFPDEQAFREWHESPAYQDAAAFRRAGGGVVENAIVDGGDATT